MSKQRLSVEFIWRMESVYEEREREKSLYIQHSHSTEYEYFYSPLVATAKVSDESQLLMMNMTQVFCLFLKTNLFQQSFGRLGFLWTVFCLKKK